MYIDRIVISNVKGFGPNQVDVSLDRGGGTYAGWTVFAGRNGAGKTTLLRAVALATYGLRSALRLMDSFVGWIHAPSTSSSAKVMVTLIPSELDTFSPPEPRPQVLVNELHWITPAPGLDPRIGSGEDGGAEGPWSDKSENWFIAGYGPFRRLSGQTVEAQRMMGRSPQTSRVGTLFHDEASLLDAMEWLRDLRLREADGKPEASALLKTAFELLSDGLLPDPRVRVIRYDADGLWVSTAAGKELPVGDFSDGYRTVIALVLDIVRGMHQCYGAVTLRDGAVDLPGVVLIDEVDAHLHVSWQQRIGPWLKAHFPRVQFLVTSHSPFVCQAADAKGIILLPPPGSDEPLRIADDALYHRAVNGPADAALLSDLFGMEHTWSDASEQKRVEMARLEGRILHAKATHDEVARYHALRDEIPTDDFETADVDRALRDEAAHETKSS